MLAWLVGFAISFQLWPKIKPYLHRIFFIPWVRLTLAAASFSSLVFFPMYGCSRSSWDTFSLKELLKSLLPEIRQVKLVEPKVDNDSIRKVSLYLPDKAAKELREAEAKQAINWVAQPHRPLSQPPSKCIATCVGCHEEHQLRQWVTPVKEEYCDGDTSTYDDGTYGWDIVDGEWVPNVWPPVKWTDSYRFDRNQHTDLTPSMR